MNAFFGKQFYLVYIICFFFLFQLVPHDEQENRDREFKFKYVWLGISTRAVYFWYLNTNLMQEHFIDFGNNTSIRYSNTIN